ncbi:cell envelope integrity protein CreD [Flavobacteriaceae bacterium XHP0103]|uniref:cell envelope integrity protein CreD n=1 Tax=Marixanthotalea marina TaxID=2844359 RepID=UPI00298A0260|nr:cell envelope integrity protein CreD [Marixanthotalea marina]MBU3821160.1 cell envelope integrity protein CreD [Marixanthotalea marina]
MENTNLQQSNKFGNWLKTSITARMLMVGFLIIILLIPLAFIRELIRERSERKEIALSEINQQWGNELLIYGPVLELPYKTYSEKTVTDRDTKKTYTETIESVEYAYFFPENLEINSDVNPEEKSRGIYNTAVYNSKVKLNGNFSIPDFESLEINPENIIWDKAKLIIKSSNVKGVYEANVSFFNKKYTITSKYGSNEKKLNPLALTMHTLETKHLEKIDTSSLKNMPFNIDLNIKGSEQIRFVPIGRTTEAQITSNWKTANFIGEYLPYNGDKINENGFDAKWKVLELNRPFSQQYKNSIPDITEFASGVNFMIPVDEYQQSERSAKYGFLVIALTFLIFFLIQTLSKIDIHPFQYLMIGLALTMFYTLLVSISEHSNFLKAYLIAGVSVIVLITLYSKSILKTFKFPIFIGLSLSALYTFIYVIIQLENYALLVGCIGLFLILAIVMYVSRKIDWNNG